MYDNLRNNINDVQVFPDDEIDAFVSSLETIHLSKGEYFLKEGQISNHLAFVDKGLAMYYKNLDGTEIPVDFAIENQWVAYLQSFNNRTPSDMNIKVLEETTLFTLEAGKMHELLIKYPRFLALKSYYVEKSLLDVAQHGANLAMLYAKQRYHQLMKDKPYLINRVPQYYLAAYLGIKPESLSRIRKEASRMTM
ncbi:MAG TPA: Crp/Fnr family transcriptional regulator [Chryseolinea sp.]|nr:Crp/Fnr family transcriptional regulator [Chryseolinea sp.]HPM32591.1 Crp/Fnr family transcriptional regulator [Chryseolinea sp.]